MMHKILSFVLVVGLGVLMLPGSSQAQSPELEDCIQAFEELAVVWATDAVSSGFGHCSSQKGKGWVQLRGTDPTYGLYLNFNARMLRDGGTKECMVAIAVHPDNDVNGPYPYTRNVLYGSDASKWNKYLRGGAGCDYAMALLD